MSHQRSEGQRSDGQVYFLATGEAGWDKRRVAHSAATAARNITPLVADHAAGLTKTPAPSRRHWPRLRCAFLHADRQ